MTKFNIKPIKTQKDYQTALQQVELLWDAPKDSADADVLDVLATLIDKYEDDHFPINTPDPVEAIKFRMEQSGISKSDLAIYLGGKNRASEILSKKRRLTLGMIRSLNKNLKIPAGALIKEYKLKTTSR